MMMMMTIRMIMMMILMTRITKMMMITSMIMIVMMSRTHFMAPLLTASGATLNRWSGKP